MVSATRTQHQDRNRRCSSDVADHDGAFGFKTGQFRWNTNEFTAQSRLSKVDIEERVKSLIEKHFRDVGLTVGVTKILLANETSTKLSGIAWLTNGDKLDVSVVFDGDAISASWRPTL